MQAMRYVQQLKHLHQMWFRAYLLNGDCVAACPAGQVSLGSGVIGRRCELCNNCGVCSAGYLLRCISGYALVNGQCQTDFGTGADVVSHVSVLRR